MNDVLCKVHGRDIYDEAADLPLDMQGWNSDVPAVVELIRKLSPRLVVEVGSWKGGSSATIARALPQGSTLICVDTWLGSFEHWTRDDLRPLLACRAGLPRLYDVFLSNMRRAGLRDRVVPLPLPSIQAARLIRHLGLTADLVYLDGSHEYADVVLDLEAWRPLLSGRGVLCGDDYSADWPGVVRAVNEFCQQHAVGARVEGPTWIVEGGPNGPDEVGEQ